MPFDMRRDDDGYTIYDVATGKVAVVNDTPIVGLTIEAAADMVDLLNRLERQKDSEPQQ